MGNPHGEDGLLMFIISLRWKTMKSIIPSGLNKWPELILVAWPPHWWAFGDDYIVRAWHDIWCFNAKWIHIIQMPCAIVHMLWHSSTLWFLWYQFGWFSLGYSFASHQLLSGAVGERCAASSAAAKSLEGGCWNVWCRTIGGDGVTQKPFHGGGLGQSTKVPSGND